VLECEDRIERQRLTLRELHEKEKQRGFRKLALEARCGGCRHHHLQHAPLGSLH
jgi:hypothetical protein